MRKKEDPGWASKEGWARRQDLAVASNELKAGFFQNVFDTTFGKLVAPSIVEFVYTLFLVANSILTCGLIVVGIILSSKRNEAIWALVAIAASLLYYILSTLLFRLLMERTLVLFRMSEDIRHIRNNSS